MRHQKPQIFWKVRVGRHSSRPPVELRVSPRWNSLFAAKLGDQWFWVQHDQNGDPFIDPHTPIPGGNYDDGLATAA